MNLLPILNLLKKICCSVEFLVQKNYFLKVLIHQRVCLRNINSKEKNRKGESRAKAEATKIMNEFSDSLDKKDAKKNN